MAEIVEKLVKVEFNKGVYGSTFCYREGETGELTPESAKEAIELGIAKKV